MNVKKTVLHTSLFTASISLLISCATVQKLNLSMVSVPEEGGINFTKITDDADNVKAPYIKTAGILSMGNSQKVNLEWWMNTMIAISPDGSKIAYINEKNDMWNVMIKSSQAGGPSTQRTFRNAIMDFTWSPDGTSLCFTEYRNQKYGIYLVNANQGSVVQQISSTGTNDLAGVITQDGNKIFFHRGEGIDQYSLWSFDRKTNLYANYSRGMTPCLIPNDPNALICARYTDKKECEIWKINYVTGVEDILLSQSGKSFTSPQLSPDGKWILCTGNSVTEKGKNANTDIYVVRIDGTQLTQLTYHPGNDISAIWAPDGKSIYFLSQRGSVQKGNKPAQYNVWKMDFNLN